MKHTDVKELFVESYLDLDAMRIIQNGNNFYVQEADVLGYMDAAGITDIREAVNNIIWHNEVSFDTMSKDNFVVIATNEETVDVLEESGVLCESVEGFEEGVLGKAGAALKSVKTMMQDKVYRFFTNKNAAAAIKNIDKFPEAEEKVKAMIAAATTVEDCDLLISDCEVAVSTLERALEMDVTDEQKAALRKNLSGTKSDISKLKAKKAKLEKAK